MSMFSGHINHIHCMYRTASGTECILELKTNEIIVEWTFSLNIPQVVRRFVWVFIEIWHFYRFFLDNKIQVMKEKSLRKTHILITITSFSSTNLDYLKKKNNKKNKWFSPQFKRASEISLEMRNDSQSKPPTRRRGKTKRQLYIWRLSPSVYYCIDVQKPTKCNECKSLDFYFSLMKNWKGLLK